MSYEARCLKILSTFSAYSLVGVVRFKTAELLDKGPVFVQIFRNSVGDQMAETNETECGIFPSKGFLLD